jgi:REP element-mobilizing transposase RayT
MAVRYKTEFIPNEIYFITFTVLGWKHIFKKKKYCDLVFKWFDYMRDNYENKIHGYVIMPNHIHVLLFISGKSPQLPVLIYNAKRFMGLGIKRLLKEDGKVDILNFFNYNKTKTKSIYTFFEPRYDSLLIWSQKFYLEKLNYIHNNPCSSRWKLTENPEDYIYSSASYYSKDEGSYKVDVTGF